MSLLLHVVGISFVVFQSGESTASAASSQMTVAAPSSGPSEAAQASPDGYPVAPDPVRDVAPVAPDAVASPSDASPSPSSGGAGVYVVKSGDTLTALSHRFKCSLDELAQLNGKTVKALSRLTIGQRLKVPVAADR